MKHLGNCTNTEFLRQAMKIRGPLQAWLKRTGIPAIRTRRPADFEPMTPEAEAALPPEEQEARRAVLIRQARENTADIIDAALRMDFENTIDLICMATFHERSEFDDHPLPEYLEAIGEIMRSEAVVSFFRVYL